jgi:hypothetical protein
MFTNNPILYVILLWPNQLVEGISLRLGAEKAILSIPQPLSLLSQNELLELAENLRGEEHEVGCLRIENNKIFMGIEGQMISYEISDPLPNYNLDGEAAAVYIWVLKKYFWPYSDLVRKDEIDPQELSDFLEAHPNASKFIFIQRITAEFFQNNQKPKLGKGKRSKDTKERILIKNYALYNLIKSLDDGENGIEQVFLNISKFIEEDRNLDEDYYGTIRRAYYRAKSEVELTGPENFSNLTFFIPVTENQNSASNIYLSIITPLGVQSSL